MLGADKQKAWLSDMRFAEKYGFRPVDRADEYLLLAKSFDGSSPRFAENAKKQTIDLNDLTVYYDDQCPYIADRIKALSDYCAEKNIPARFIHVDSLEQAKSLPCVFGNFAVFYGGKFIPSIRSTRLILKNEGKAPNNNPKNEASAFFAKCACLFLWQIP